MAEKELKRIGLTSLTEETEDNLIFRLGHSYCSLLLFKFTASENREIGNNVKFRRKGV